MEQVAVAQQVGALDGGRIDPHRVGGLVDGGLDHVHPLRTAEAAKRRVRLQVGAARRRRHAHVGDEVGVGGVEQRAREHRRRQVGEGAGVLVEGGLVDEDLAGRGQADPEVGGVRVALAGHPDVVEPVQHQLHRRLQVGGGQGGHRRPVGGLVLLAAEAAAEALHVHLDLVHRPAKHRRHYMLHRRRPLGGGEHLHRAILLRDGAGALRLQVEVLLAADLAASLHHHAAIAPGAGDIAHRHGARRVDQVAVGERLARVDHHRQFVDVNLDQLARLPRLVRGAGHHQGDRVADEAHLTLHQQLLVLQDRTEPVDAGDVGGSEHGHDTGRCARRVGGQPFDDAVRLGRAEHRGVQHLRRRRHVVHVLRLAAHVQVGVDVLRVGRFQARAPA